MTIDFHGLYARHRAVVRGQGLVARWGILRRYSIPEPWWAAWPAPWFVFALYCGAGIVVSFDLEARTRCCLYFFAAIGMQVKNRRLARCAMVGGPC